jgi:ATP-dependent RNA helicase SUPV3L1/SUV3
MLLIFNIANKRLFHFNLTVTVRLQMVRQYSRNEPITKNWMSNTVDWPLPAPKTIMDLVHLEAVFDVLELYLWLR